MSPIQKQDGEQRSGIALEGSQVALGPARSLTSHARRIYAGKYAGRYRLAEWVFAFDAFLVGVALALSAATIFFLFSAPARFDGGLAIDMRSASLRGSEATPFTVTVRATDGKSHDGLRLRMELPDWAEIVRSEPRQSADGSIDLGSIKPRSSRSAIIVIRPRAADTDMHLVFHVHQDDWTGFVRDIDGSDTLHVGSSALAVEVDPAVTSTASGAVIPFIVSNTASVAIPSVIFRVVGVEGGSATVGGSDTFALGSIGAGESRRVFVDVPKVVSSTMSILWQLQDGAQSVSSGTSTFPVTSHASAVTDGRFPAGTFPLTAEARYYSGSGDQIGIGPLPPTVGKMTTYWVAFTVGPTDGGMKDLRIHAILPKGVVATGKFAAPVDASFVSEGRTADWHVDALPAVGAARISFAFEVSLTPIAEQVGVSAPLLTSAQATASTEGGTPLTASSTPLTTDLMMDVKAAGKGIIQP